MPQNAQLKPADRKAETLLLSKRLSAYRVVKDLTYRELAARITKVTGRLTPSTLIHGRRGRAWNERTIHKVRSFLEAVKA